MIGSGVRWIHVATTTAVIAIGASSLAAQERFEWNGTIDADDWVVVQNIIGDIEVVVTDGTQIELVATKRGDPDDFDRVSIEVVEDRDGVTICAIYPNRKRNSTQECAGEEFDRPRHRGNLDVAVGFELRVPADTQLKGITVSGDVRMRGVLVHAVVTTVNGDIEVASRGSLTATTVNGSVDARLEGANLDGPVKLTTVNGSIRLDVNDDINADVEARWVTGGLRSEIPLSVRGRMSRSARGQFGDGGHEVSLSTVNGSIEIR